MTKVSEELVEYGEHNGLLFSKLSRRSFFN